MPKQYTFKTTRDTKWLEDILDSAPPQDRSRIIRQYIIAGLGEEKVTQKTDVLQKTDITQKTDVLQKTDVTPLSDPLPTIEVGIKSSPLPPPPMTEIEGDESVNFDSKLDDIGGMYS